MLLDQQLDVAMRVRLADGRLHCTALGMPQNEHDGCSYVFHGILDRSHLVDAANISGNSDHEDVPNPLIEHDFQRHARIGTGENGGERMLPVCAGLSNAGGTTVGVDALFLQETRVAVCETMDRLVWRHIDCLIGGRHSPTSNNQTGRTKRMVRFIIRVSPL